MNHLLLFGAILLLATLSMAVVEIDKKCKYTQTIPHLSRKQFSGYEKHIIHIKYENCRIETIDTDTFQGLSNLKHFQLVNNDVEVTIAPKLFSNNTKLEEIILSSNIKIHEDTFKDLSQLKVLKLQDNEISVLPKKLLWRKPDLQILSLKNNSIEIIDEHAFNFNEELTNYDNMEKSNLSSNNIKHTQWRVFTVNLKSLDISINYLSDLPENIFYNLTQLETLDLHNNQLTSLPNKLFSNLRLVKKLDLSSNKISTLDPETFTNNIELLNLILSHNQLTELHAGLFKNLYNLQYLHLDNNQIQSIEEKVFPSSANFIAAIYLQYNYLETLNATVFEDLPSDADLNLSENPWICDCRINRLVRLWKKSTRGKIMFYLPKCEAPEEFMNEWWDDLIVDRLCAN